MPIKKNLLSLALPAALIFFIAISLWWKINNAPLKKDSPKSRIFVIKRGESLSSIAKRLKKEGLIRSPLVFQILVKRENLTIQAGDFRLSPSMTPLEIAKELTHGTLDVWVTIIEGWRVEEIAEEINSKFKIQNSKFIAEAKDYEGFLFPDTYLIPKEATSGAVIKILKKNFEKKIKKLASDLQKSDLSLREVIILASIVEREAKYERDRPIVAGILLKRLRSGWPLQADATVQYSKASAKCQVESGKCNWWPKITKADLKINSPYNTYLYPGLPPAPICNPGFSSIKAVVYSQETEYWYYLSDKEGRMHYAKTLKEHNKNIRKYLFPS